MLPKSQLAALSVVVLLQLLGIFLGKTEAFDSILDTKKHSNRWKFSGSFSYANSTSDEEIKTLVPHLLTSSPMMNKASREGVWYIKYHPDGKNLWKMQYSLSHLLFRQGWLTYLADPSVPIIIKTSGDREVGRFWSDGKTWCDAVFKINLHNMFYAEVNTSKPGDYAMVDKIVLGVMSNVTSLKNQTLNPCLTSSLISDENSDEVPDMEVKKHNEFLRRNPDQGPPDMEDKTPQGIRPTEQESSTESTLRTYQTETGGAICNCACTCSNKPNNSTTTSTTINPRTPL